jgi:hypothetical protein
MLDALEDVNSKYCNCFAGAAGKGVEYLSTGTCLDYVYEELHVPYSYLFEIYEDKNFDWYSFIERTNNENVLEGPKI